MCSSFIAASRLFIVLFDFLLFWKRLPAGPVQLRWPMPSLFRLLRWPCRLFGWRGWKRLSRHWWVYCPFISLFVYWLDKISPKRGGGGHKLSSFPTKRKECVSREVRMSFVKRTPSGGNGALVSVALSPDLHFLPYTHTTHTHTQECFQNESFCSFVTRRRPPFFSFWWWIHVSAIGTPLPLNFHGNQTSTSHVALFLFIGFVSSAP